MPSESPLRGSTVAAAACGGTEGTETSSSGSAGSPENDPSWGDDGNRSSGPSGAGGCDISLNPSGMPVSGCNESASGTKSAGELSWLSCPTSGSRRSRKRGCRHPRLGNRCARVDERRHRRKRCPGRWARVPALMQQSHELRNSGERTPFVKTVAPHQRVLAHGVRIDLVGQLLEHNRTHRNVVDRDVPLRHLGDTCRRRDWNRRRLNQDAAQRLGPTTTFRDATDERRGGTVEERRRTGEDGRRPRAVGASCPNVETGSDLRATSSKP